MTKLPDDPFSPPAEVPDAASSSQSGSFPSPSAVLATILLSVGIGALGGGVFANQSYNAFHLFSADSLVSGTAGVAIVRSGGCSGAVLALLLARFFADNGPPALAWSRLGAAALYGVSSPIATLAGIGGVAVLVSARGISMDTMSDWVDGGDVAWWVVAFLCRVMMIALVWPHLERHVCWPGYSTWRRLLACWFGATVLNGFAALVVWPIPSIWPLE